MPLEGTKFRLGDARDPQGVAAPPSGGWMPLVPLVALLLTTGVSLVLGLQVAPETTAVEPWIGTYSEYSEVARARFNSQALIWAGLGVTVILALVAMLVVSYRVVCDSAMGSKWFSALLLVPVLFGILVLAGDLFGAAHLSVPLRQLHEKGFVVWPLSRFTAAANWLTASGIAALFAGASAILVGVRSGASDTEDSVRRLQVLLGLGALATVIGVLEIGALHRLPGAAARGSQGWSVVRPQVEVGLYGGIDKAIAGGEAAAASDQLLKSWLVQDLKLQEPAAKVLVAQLVGQAAANAGAQERLRSAASASILAAADEASRKEVSGALDQYAAHAASFWGVVFTTALAMMYLPAAAVIVRGSASAKTAQALAVGISTTPGTTWDTLVKPFLRLLATLAPLLVGALAELLRSASQVP